MSKPDTYISVWFDDTSDEHAWIVDRCDKHDNSETVKIFEKKAQAAEFATRYSEKTGLPIR